MKYIATNGDMMKCPVVICHEFTIFHLRCNRRGRLVPKSRHAGLLRPDGGLQSGRSSENFTGSIKEPDFGAIHIVLQATYKHQMPNHILNHKRDVGKDARRD